MELVNRTLEEFIELNVAGLSETDNQSCESSPALELFSGPFLTEGISAKHVLDNDGRIYRHKPEGRRKRWM